jgi:hypothetical protein
MTRTDKKDIIRTYRREVPVKLTRDETHDYGKKLAAKQREHDALDAKRKTVAKQYAGELSTVAEEIRRYTAAIDSGEELRNSEVYDVLDGSQVFTYLKATGELIDQRPAGYVDVQADAFPEVEQEPPDPLPEPEKPARKRGKKQA